jgi:hypothetical protein
MKSLPPEDQLPAVQNSPGSPIKMNSAVGISSPIAGDPDSDDEKKEADIRFHDVFTCTVGRKRSSARYYVNDSDEIAQCLAALTNSLNDGKGFIELLQFEDSLSSAPSMSSSRNNLRERIGSLPLVNEKEVFRTSSGQSI